MGFYCPAGLPADGGDSECAGLSHERRRTAALFADLPVFDAGAHSV